MSRALEPGPDLATRCRLPPNAGRQAVASSANPANTTTRAVVEPRIFRMTLPSQAAFVRTTLGHAERWSTTPGQSARSAVAEIAEQVVGRRRLAAELVGLALEIRAGHRLELP